MNHWVLRYSIELNTEIEGISTGEDSPSFKRSHIAMEEEIAAVGDPPPSAKRRHTEVVIVAEEHFQQTDSIISIESEGSDHDWEEELAFLFE